MILHIFSVLAPIFGLILLGYGCRKTNRIGPTAAAELNRFVVWLCLPAMLFESTATASVEEIWQPGFIWVIAIGTLAIFVATIFYTMWRGRSLADAGLEALSASYANTGYVGIPLCIFVLGEAGLEPALIASLVVVCVLFAIAVVCVEVGLQAGQSVGVAIRKVSVALAKNPIVVTPIVGVLWNASGLGVNQGVLEFLHILGTATIPCALVSLGAFLASKQAGSAEGTMTLVFIKLIVHPVLTWVLAYQVFHLPPMWAKAAVLLSALPTGTGPYMLAELYQREASVASRTILLSTLGSLVTLTICLYLLP
ncbi:AEC family transporter [Oceanobacter mangrovi]|uniref:AEC family transporter n=1 Tax=Oceanobacter mangrovi TaxID=2862510 RepID=UPI001FE8671B|nr:AEC family transporter [Oceanobacter mangrovi]